MPNRLPLLLALILLLIGEPAGANKRIALSFDDVPRKAGAFFTPAERSQRLITALRQAGVRQAVFFVNPGHLDQPDGAGGEARIMAYVAAGHLIANHSFSHPHLRQFSAADYLADIDKAEAWLKGRPGYRPWFRFPYLFEGGEEEYRRTRRHPHKYHITVFGTPGARGLWGWRFEGHHLSLNFSIQDGVVVSSTPEFFGANPGSIDAGPGRNLRVLAQREDLARQILKACNDDQKKQMWISDKAPDDIRGAGAPQPVVDAAVGLRFADMSPDQQKRLKELIGEYLSAMPAQVVRDRMKGIEKSGMDDVRFAWWGDAELNKRHHYVIQGATFIIEYNNTQNEANHVHAMWRNIGGDFNLPPASAATR